MFIKKCLIFSRNSGNLKSNFFKILRFLLFFYRSLIRGLFTICGVYCRAALIKLKKVSVLSREKAEKWVLRKIKKIPLEIRGKKKDRGSI